MLRRLKLVPKACRVNTTKRGRNISHEEDWIGRNVAADLWAPGEALVTDITPTFGHPLAG